MPKETYREYVKRVVESWPKWKRDGFDSYQVEVKPTPTEEGERDEC